MMPFLNFFLFFFELDHRKRVLKNLNNRWLKTPNQFIESFWTIWICRLRHFYRVFRWIIKFQFWISWVARMNLWTIRVSDNTCYNKRRARRTDRKVYTSLHWKNEIFDLLPQKHGLLMKVKNAIMSCFHALFEVLKSILEKLSFYVDVSCDSKSLYLQNLGATGPTCIKNGRMRWLHHPSSWIKRRKPYSKILQHRPTLVISLNAVLKLS